MSTESLSTLEIQGLLLVSELELFIKAGGKVNSAVALSMNQFRYHELLKTGSNDYKMINMLKALSELKPQ